MLSVLPALALAALPHPDAELQTMTGAELAMCAGVPPAGGHFVLAEGERAEIEIPAKRFRSAGLWWKGQLGTAWVELRSKDGSTSPPQAVLESHDMAPEVVGVDRPAGAARVSGLVARYDQLATGVRLVVFGPTDLTEMTFVTIAPLERDPRDSGGLIVHGSGGHPKPNVYSRSFWGASPPTCTYSYCNTTHVGIHHSASSSHYNASSLSQCASNVKGIQTYHQVSNGWCDIGYNYVICRHGDIFEGRGGGDNVKGAHDGKNCGSMGTCLMGYFHTPINNQPTSQMLEAMEELAAWKCCQQGIDPLGSSYYAGLGATEMNIYGHRDVSATACPGDHVYSQMGAIRQGVEDKLNGPPGGGNEVILDNPTGIALGAWATGTSSSQKFGSNYRWTSTGYDNDLFAWVPNVPSSGSYRLDIWWTAGSNRNPVTFFGAYINGVTYYAWANQQGGGGQWNTWGNFFFPAGTSSVVGVFGFGDPGYVVVADAFRLVKN